MAATVVDNPLSLTSESKTARKKKVKADAGTNGAIDAASNISSEVPKDSLAAVEADNPAEHPYVRELQKHVRNVNKKLAALHKTDAIIAENKDVSLDELVAQRKINADQRASALKKPQLQAQLAQFEEQLEQYRKFDSDYQLKLIKQKEELAQDHVNEVAKIKADLQTETAEAGDKELRRKLLIFSQFLRAAAAKRTVEEEADTDESRAFEGALLLVYGGDQKAVDTTVNIIEGAGDSVPSIEGIELPVTYAQIKQASVNHAPFPAEEAWIDQTVGVANTDTTPVYNDPTATVDPTIANASLTELEQQGRAETLTNGGLAGGTDETSGNVAGERWDTAAAGISADNDRGNMEDSYEIIPRPSEEVDIPSQQPQPTRWDEDQPTYEAATGNKASEQWDVKAPGEQTDDNTWASSPAQVAETIAGAADGKTAPAADDGFHEVAGRQRGRGGGRGRGGDGEYRGRGGRRGHFRGGRGGSDGEFRGRGGLRGGRGDGEFRGGRGRGRGGGGPRAGGPAPVASS